MNKGRGVVLVPSEVRVGHDDPELVGELGDTNDTKCASLVLDESREELWSQLLLVGSNEDLVNVGRVKVAEEVVEVVRERVASDKTCPTRQEMEQRL